MQAEKKAREAEKKRLKALERKEKQALETALVKGGAAGAAEVAAAAARSEVDSRRGEHVHAARSEVELAKPSAAVTPDAESLDTALEAVLRAAEVDVMYEEMAKEMALKKEAEEYADRSASDCMRIACGLHADCMRIACGLHADCVPQDVRPPECL